MEAATAMGTLSGPSVEATTTPVAYEDDSRQPTFSTNTVPKPIVPALLASMAEMKGIGSRFHEDCHETRLRSSRSYKGKGKEAVLVEKERKQPLRLLDLPVDILKDIVNQVTHTNDLTSLALCHSALHRLTVPHIYSRFDIVWPDTTVHSEPRSGVDALTYGLATLVMAEEVFGESPGQKREQSNRFAKSGQGKATEMAIRRRRGNHYAQFTKKFSLGNGPSDWVQEYLITKEGGKMLGTLVALAVARMRALETFIWDMPTGILRDVWLALSSLGDWEDGKPCRLEKLWVRWHDNSLADAAVPPPPPPMNLNAVSPAPLHTSSSHSTSSAILRAQIHPAALDRVEHPSFSVLPPLKSLSVLDIDELAYLDEMAILIGRSLDKLRELRIGIARHALPPDWTTVWEGDGLQQVDPDYPTAGSITIGERRLGGVLGTLTGFVCDMRKPKIMVPERTRRRSRTASFVPKARTPSPPPVVEPSLVAERRDLAAAMGRTYEDLTHATGRDVLVDPSPHESPELSDNLPRDQANTAVDDEPSPTATEPYNASVFNGVPSTPPTNLDDSSEETPAFFEPEGAYLDRKLQLDSLELERVPISVPVLQKAIDWTRLTSLTLLHCQNHEQLWKTLRRSFAPTPKDTVYPTPRRTSIHSPRKGSKPSISATHEMEYDYPLKLTKIHTNTVSPALISFLKETLAPNSLEVLFLQEARTYTSPVTVDSIFRGPLRRHRNSLKKLLIDSSEKTPPTSSTRWRRWLLTREILTFVCSGKMPALRELGLAIDYRDWHFFLQHLPSIPQLRSLYIPFIADHVHGSNVDPRELALSVMDIVALRPEVELCYMGIGTKCFEILEARGDGGRPESRLDLGPGGGVGDEGGSDEDEDDEDGEEDDDEDEDEGDGVEDTESDDDEDEGMSTESEGDGEDRVGRLRLREILFYDDKVAVFKARHGRL